MTTVCLLRSMTVGVTLAYWWSAAHASMTANHYEPDSVTGRKLRLIEYVLSRDDHFRPILEQKIKIDRPPYHDDDDDADMDPETKSSLQLVNGGGGGEGSTVISTLHVLQSVRGSFPWLGSYVEYATRALATAVTCHAYTSVSLLMELVQGMEDAYAVEKTSSPDAAKAMDGASYEATWFALAIVADKLAAVNGHLGRMVDMTYTYDKLKRADGAHDQSTTLQLIRDELNMMIGKQCVRPEPERVYADLGLDASSSPPPKAGASQADYKSAFERFVDRLVAVYSEFGVHAISLKNWAQILDFDIPLSKDVNVDLYLDQMIADDPIGWRIIRDSNRQLKETIAEVYFKERKKND